MSEIKDDPREVLVLLNSLGFVGITATQLKAFMKDLKVYRKIKEREKQQRREEMKAKIISKQQAMIKENRRCRNTEYSSNNVAPSESSNSYNNESSVKVKIRCIPKQKAVQNQIHSTATVVKSDEKVTTIKYHNDDVTQADEPDRIYCRKDRPNAKSYSDIKCSKSESSRQNIPKSSATKDNRLIEGYKLNAEKEKQARSVTSVPEYRTKELTVPDAVKPRSRSAASDPIENIRTQSALSTKSSVNSAHKSFIRPWRLQPEVQRNVINKKCDPVTLYQKYQQEWKQISFPGEAKHSKVRWAVREKMLGVDPHPVPLARKSASMPILKKK